MAENTRRNELIGRLDQALRDLKDVVGLQRADTLAAFLEVRATSCYVVGKKLLLAHHFNFAPAILLHDPELGTLGIIETVLPPADVQGAKTLHEQIVEDVSRFVDSATYVRHLLLRDAKRTGTSAVTVELVLLTSDETESEREAGQALGAALRQLSRDTDSLYHVGIGVLTWSGAQSGFDGRMRRAFPWLLGATRRWLKSPNASATPAPQSDARRLERLTLTDFRVAGRRTIEFAKPRVHLVHGANGTGKTSLVEALELVSSGKVERIEGALRNQDKRDYQAVIKNHRATSPASIRLEWRPGADGQETATDHEVVAEGLKAPLDPAVDANSFRLDQPLMDQLIGKFPHARAAAFMRAFFPEAQSPRTAYEEAHVRSTEANTKLQATVKLFNDAKAALEQVAGWRGGRVTSTDEDFSELLNTWLELTALRELTRSENSVRKTFRAAHANGWVASGAEPELPGHDKAADVAALEEREKKLTEELDKLVGKLASFSRDERSQRAGNVAPTALGAEQIAVLDEVTRWLFDKTVLTTDSEGLGRALFRVIVTRDSAREFRYLHIGHDNWAQSLVSRLESLLQACRSLEGDGAPATWPISETCQPFADAALAHNAARAASDALTAEFEGKLRPGAGASGEYDHSLIAAVNEVMALFTPARWSYQDLRLPPARENGRVSLGLEVGEQRTARAELFLNTAELNLFTVSLFLLCSARVRKPLGLLVFDDPLQNMDELTSTSLARGLAKLVRLFAALGRREEFLFLFHGAADLERFQSELPAAVYRLPWLVPSSATSRPASEPPIKALPGSIKSEPLQTLAQFVSEGA